MTMQTLYVTNLPQQTDEETLRALFSQYGEVESVEFGTNERFDVPYALVTMSSEKATTKANHNLNGYLLDEHHLSISYPDVDEATVERGLSKKQRQTAEAVVKELGEHIRKPVRRIHTMILLCGHSFVLHLVEEAKAIDAGEGMMTQDGERRRTLGGVFFTLANGRMAPPIYQIVHNRGGKLPGHTREDDRALQHLVSNPHPDLD